MNKDGPSDPPEPTFDELLTIAHPETRRLLEVHNVSPAKRDDIIEALRAEWKTKNKPEAQTQSAQVVQDDPAETSGLIKPKQPLRAPSPSEPAYPLKSETVDEPTQHQSTIWVVLAFLKKWAALGGVFLMGFCWTMIQIDEFGFAAVLLFAATIAFFIQAKDWKDSAVLPKAFRILKILAMLAIAVNLIYFAAVILKRKGEKAWSVLLENDKHQSTRPHSIADSDTSNNDPVDLGWVNDVYKVPLGKYSPGEYRVRYIIFHEESFINNKSPIFGILNGSIKNTTDDLFSKEPYVLNTPPLKLLKKLAAQFPEISDDQIPRFETTAEYDPTRISKKFESDPHYFVLNVHREDLGEENGATLGEAFGLIGADNIKHLAGKYSKIPLSTLAFIHENPEVHDVAMEQLTYNYCDAYWSLHFNSRPLKLLVLDIENLKTQPIQLRYVEGTVDDKTDLRLTPWVDDIQSTTNVIKYDFPIGTLGPGEHLLVPMKLILGSFGNINFGLHPEAVPQTIPAATLPDVNLEQGETINIYSPARKRRETFYNEYIVGSSFEPVLVDSLGMLRRFSRSNLIYHGPLEMGSCPYAFLLTPVSKEWNLAGRLIPNRLGKELEGRSKLLISYANETKISIRELEDEVSFLDQVYLELHKTDGSIVKLYSTSESLRVKDFNYLTLRRGDEVSLEFPKIPFSVRRAYLISDGYFVPAATTRK
jgi:hypothetical protein